MVDLDNKRWKSWDEVPLILTTDDVVHLSGLKKRTLEGRRLHKEPPPYRRLGLGPTGKVIYLKAEIKTWLEETTKPGDESA